MNDKIVEILKKIYLQGKDDEAEGRSNLAMLPNLAQQIPEAMWIKVEDGEPKEQGEYWVVFKVEDKLITSRDFFNGNHWLSKMSDEFTHYQKIVIPSITIGK